MNIPYLCIALALALVYLPRFTFVVAAMAKAEGGYDNAEPRQAQLKLEGAARRALAAHQNGFESFAPFAASILMAEAAGVGLPTLTNWALVHVGARVVYVIAYLANWHPVRSLAFTVGLVAVGALMAAAITQ